MRKELWFIFIFLFASLAYAQPPVVFQSASSDYLAIRFSELEYITPNFDYKVHVHVFNGTSGYPLFSGISCYLHVYNTSLNQVVSLTTTTPSFDGGSPIGEYEFLVGGGNFTKLGDYPFVAQCNTSNVGGYVSGIVESTRDGLPPSNTRKLDSIFGIGIIAALLFWFAMKLEDEHYFLKLLLIFSTVSLLVLIPFTLINTPSELNIYNAYLWVVKFFWVYVGVYLVYWVYKKYLMDKRILQP